MKAVERTKRELSPAEIIAQRRRRAQAQEVARGAIATIKSSSLNDPEFRMEVCRSTIRAFTRYAAELTDAGRAMGLLSGAAAEIAPAFVAERSSIADAEALFIKPAKLEETLP